MIIPYNLLITVYYLCYCCLLPFFLLAGKPRRKILNRLGIIRARRHKIWIHAVSGGEAVLSKTILKLLGTDDAFITTMSDNGYETLERIYAGSRVEYSYLCLDFFPAVFTLARRISSSFFLCLEHDSWPNLLRCLRRNGCQLFLLNAFIKKNDLDIFRRFPGIFDFIHKPYHGLLAQNPDTAELFKSITRLEVKAFGNLKYASVPSAQKIKFPAAKKIIICAGSTHDREEKIIIDAASSLLKKHACLLIIAPRHSRCRELSSLLSTLPYRWKLFSEKRTEAADIILCDQNGLLCSLYKACDISIVGGSFIDTRGGHNILEPGYFGKPVIYGNFMVNYSELTGELEKKKMAFRCSAAELGRTIEKLASSKTLREKCGQGLRKKIITEQKKLSNLKKVIGAD